MILIIGGSFQGKTDFAKTLSEKEPPLVIDGTKLQKEDIKCADIITNMHLYIQKRLKEDENLKIEMSEILEQNPRAIVTIAELGCGIVPVEAFDRCYREMTGRISCELAQKADAVYRVTCGIGTRIK